ncbi:hypothetical protein [Flavihumibacter petaseus]|uniref:Uncharacterized protein n=1 Tax=Flavihumibacter petaseus NBRC 106054 TaxID=1220578 RepID=A0A0E9MW87_9BACT|nr:hypothetical protein [Flavihumibacter petaseus]GAO41773.1 hypothetical protein FPE01S_01_07870 [Flavihumibacter petaseus NBRC 106054]
MTIGHEVFELEKFVWTQDDYGQMGWHDSSIYGLSFLPVNENGTAHLVLDIDYIFKWVHPIKPVRHFSFWVAPCTLVFKDTFGLTMNIDRRGGTTDMLEVADIYLVDKTEQERDNWIYDWKLDLQEGFISFKSSGFVQIVRQKPILTDEQVLTLKDRNGIGFSQTPYEV